jgi:hypothetical protein
MCSFCKHIVSLAIGFNFIHYNQVRIVKLFQCFLFFMQAAPPSP